MLDTISLRIPNTIIKMGGSSKISQFIKDIEPSKILIITDKGIVQAGLTSSIESSLKGAGYKFDIYDDCQPNAPSSSLQKCTKVAKEGNYDLLIGVGGGSTMDSTKAISFMTPDDMNLQEFFGGKKPTNVIPVILVPTTAGTGSEWDDCAVITDESIGEKKLIARKEFLAKGAILDPELTLNLPKKITAETGMDALSHAIEGYMTRNPNIVSDMFAVTAIGLISDNLRLAYAGGSQAAEARYNMLIASAFAIKAPTMALTSLTHHMDSELVMKTHIAHGAACGILLPHDMQFQLPAAMDRLAKIAEMMGVKVDGLPVDKAAQKAIEAVKQLCKDLGLPQTMGEVGATEADISKFADNCMEYRGKIITLSSRREVSREDLVQVYRAAL